MFVSKHVGESGKYVVETYRDVPDLVETLRASPQRRSYSKSQSKDVDDFFDNMTYEQAVQALTYGLERGMESFRKTVNARRGNTTKRAVALGVEGFAPNVPRSLMGLPDAMYRDVV